MVFKSLLKVLKGEEEKINLKSNNNDTLSEEPYVIIDVDNTEEDENKIRIKVLNLENRKDANEILVWVENGCIVIAHTRDLEREVDEKYLDIIKYLRNETLKMGGRVHRVCNNRILVLPRNVVIEKVVKEEGQSMEKGKVKG